MTERDGGRRAAQDDTPDNGEGPVGRRRFLRRGAITAAVAAAGAAAVARPAAAANNSPINIGNTQDANNTGTTTTTLTGSQLRALNGNGLLSLVGEHVSSNAVGIEGRSSVGAQLRLAPNTLDLTPNSGDSHTFAAGSLVTDTNDILWYALEDGAGADTGLHPISLTAAFAPVSPPVRVYDSRPGLSPTSVPKGALNGFVGQERVVHVLQAGAPVVAVLVNLTIVNTTGAGFLAMFAADELFGAPFSSINWYADGQTVANNVTTAVEFSTGNVKVHAGGPGTTDFVIDVSGLYVI